MVDQINNGGPRVRRSLKDDIKEIMGQGENKNKIDTKAEYDAIGNLLNNNANYSSGEIAFLEGYRLEYENAQKAKEAKELEDNMTPGVKKEVDKLVKKMTKESNLTPDLQANELVLMLKDTRNRLNPADEKYIKDALINNGYGNLLPKEKKEVAKAESPSAETEPISTDENELGKTSPKESKVAEASEPEKAETTPPNPFLPVKDGETKSSAPQKPAPTVKSKNKAPEKKGTRGKDPKPEVKKYKINPGDQTKGEELADNLFNATRDPGYNKSERAEIRSALKYVNTENAYSFFTSFRTKAKGKMINEVVFNRANPNDDLGANHVSKAHYSLLGQAKKMGLSGTKEYKTLKTCMSDHDALIRNSEGENFADPQPKLIVSTDNAVKALLKLMDKYVKQNL